MKQIITIVIETDEDPSHLLDLATSWAEELAEEVDGTFSEMDGVSVEEA